MPSAILYPYIFGGIICFISLFFSIRNFINQQRKGRQQLWYKEASLLTPTAILLIDTGVLTSALFGNKLFGIFVLAGTILAGYSLILYIQKLQKL